MGWTYFHDQPSLSRAEIIKREFSCNPSDKNPWAYGFEYLSTQGSVVYAVMWRENPSENVARSYFGIVFLTTRKNGEFGYKEMGEECGPYHYDAPIKMLDLLDRLSPSDNGYALKWRQACRDKHSRKKARAAIQWQPGDKVQFSATGRVFEIQGQAGPRRGFYVRVADRSDLTQYRAGVKSFSHAVKIV
jgi:hypothetical protein